MRLRTILAFVCALILLIPGQLIGQTGDVDQRIEQLERTMDQLRQEIDDLKRLRMEEADAPEPAAGEPGTGVFGAEEPAAPAEAEGGVFGAGEPPAEEGDGVFGEPAEAAGPEEGGGVFGAGAAGEAVDAGPGTGENVEVFDLSDLDEETAAGLGPDVPAGGGGGGPGGVGFGGHLKLFAADYAEGERGGIDQNNNLSAGFHNFYLFLSKTISDWLILDVQTQTRVLVSATPRLGFDIARDANTSINTKVTEAIGTALLPKNFELKFGVFDPLFSEEYGKQLWWHEQYHGNLGLLTVQEWHDVGFELYRNFDFSAASVPLYLYLLNGDVESTYISDTYQYQDNNAGMTGMIHVAPELFVDFLDRLRLLGSFGYGKWDEEDEKDTFRYAAGAEMSYKKFTLMGEYLLKRFEDVDLNEAGTADGDEWAYYVKGLYNLSDQWRGVAKFSHSELYKPGDVRMLTDTYDVLSFGVNYFITDSSTIMPQVMYVDGERSDGSESLEYIRYTLGWRTTF